ncbi:MAG: hypothetical protein KIT83_15225 [Bryobacterales bacterium]|nr:hypothetical protein [Bryobacterales bacterium]
MQPSIGFSVSRVILPLVALCVCLLVPVRADAAPFTLDEILLALKSGKPPQNVLVRQISNRHVNFRLNPEVRARLVAAGARQPVLSAIEFNPELDTPAPPAPQAPQAPPTPEPVEVPTFQGDAVMEMPSDAVTPQEIEAALSNRDDQVALAAMIATRGVSFKYTPDLGRAWREGGATAELLAAVATATVTLPPIPEDFEPVPVARAADYNEQAAKGRLDLRLHVDDVVEVRLQGDRILWKTLKGAEGKDAGTEITQPFPMGPLRNLNVVKRDGRGQFVVLQKPAAQNNYEMMLRIYDPKGGADRYHLRIDWEHFE